jgi:Glycine cleavage system T protein (aminomethyltransferase)
MANGKAIGYVQDGDFGYSSGESIVYTYLPDQYAEAGTAVQIQCEGHTYDATVRDEPLFDRARKKIIR